MNSWSPIETVPEEIKASREDILLTKVDPVYGNLYGVGFWTVINGFGFWKSNLIGPTHWMKIPPLNPR